MAAAIHDAEVARATANEAVAKVLSARDVSKHAAETKQIGNLVSHKFNAFVLRYRKLRLRYVSFYYNLTLYALCLCKRALGWFRTSQVATGQLNP